ncbi:Arc family DNA-binding protein [Acidovorax sp. NCPPB 3576]|uniref:Arc family DNA-binding protein n=1 Tax=Acidovorax sp. NCPPB 3576 TaxID=2940488 RepID=UPI00234B5F1F|nr:Arc family DNA-binding protein [Acidovorax sp. NCPPB 3576]WCM88813.1 Arc family DNA-binding protein [Acidovorax sp. NCPPB 3576]
MAQDDYIRTALRVPPDLHKEIHEAADKAGRSFNAEIIERLQQTGLEGRRLEAEQALKATFVGVQSMLCFHLRQFYALLPPAAQAKPVNKAVRDMAIAIGHGTPDDIVRTMQTYFKLDSAKSVEHIAHSIHESRTVMDAAIQAAPGNPEELQEIAKDLKAEP